MFADLYHATCLQPDGRVTYDGTAYDAPSAALKAALQAHGAVPAGFTGTTAKPSHNGWKWIVRSADSVKLEKLRELVKEEEEDWEEDEWEEEDEQEEAGPPALADGGSAATRREKVRRRDSGARSEGQHAGAEADEAPEPPPKRRPGKEPVGDAPAAQACAALQAELQAPARAILAVFQRDAARLEDLRQQHSKLRRECQGMEAELRQLRVSQADMAAAEQAMQAATAARTQLQAQAEAAEEQCRELLAASPVGAAAGSTQAKVEELEQLAKQRRAERKQAARKRATAQQERQQLQAERERLQGQLARFAELAQQVLPFVDELQALQQQMQQQAGGAGPAHGQ